MAATDLLAYDRNAGSEDLTILLPASPVSGTPYDIVWDGSKFVFKSRQWDQQFGGQFKLESQNNSPAAGEVNGWANQGFSDDTNTADLGNYSPTMNLSRLAGGLRFSRDVELVSFSCDHRNSDGSADLEWGWLVSSIAKDWPGNGRTTTIIHDEVALNGGVGPNAYASNQNRITTIDFSDNDNRVIPAGDILNLAVAATNTHATADYYVQVMSGYFTLKYK